MDCFDTSYYRLNRQLLSLFGQWPYQSFATKMTRRLLCLFFLVLSDVPPLASAFVEELDFNMRIEIICGQVTIVLVMSRTFLFLFNQAEMRKLLEVMKLNWRYLSDKDEHEIFVKAAEEANSSMVQYAILFALGFLLNVIVLVLQPHLMGSSNNSTSRKLFYQATYFIDEEKYFYLIAAHMMLVGLVLLLGVEAGDSFFLVIMYHAVGMFKIACHQLEHAFDNYHNAFNGKKDERTVCERIAYAVEWHRRAIRFRDGIVTSTKWLNFVSAILSIIDISLALYWVVVSKGQGFGPMLGVTLMFHSFYMAIPAQKIVDSSTDITFKAYSSLWYMASTKEQTLLLMAMQRGLRPCYMQMGNIHPMTFENYTSVLKTAFSYFTVLMSLK